MKEIATIILNWNNADLTIRASRKFLEFEQDKTSVIIVDNGSYEKEKQKLKEYAENEKFIIIEEDDIENSKMLSSNLFKDNNIILFLRKNLGYAAGNNRGIRLALLLGYRYILISNNDVMLDKPILEKLRDILESNISIAIIGPKIISKSKISQGPFGKPGLVDSILMPLFYPIILLIKKMIKPKYKENKYEYCNISFVYRIMGCFMLMKVEAIAKAGYFDEHTFLYGEEEILSEKLLKIGYRVAYYPELYVFHFHEESTRRISRNRKFVIQMKSEIYYFKYYRKCNIIFIILFVFAQMAMFYLWAPILDKMKIFKR